MRGRSLHYPSLWQERPGTFFGHELLRVDGDPLFVELPHPSNHHLLRSRLLGVPNDLGAPSQRPLHPAYAPVLSSRVSSVKPQMGEALEEAGPRGFEQQFYAVAIGDVRPVDPGEEHQSLGIYEQMTLPTLDLLRSIVAALFSAHARGLHRLAIYYGGAGLGISLQANPHALAQCGVHPLP